MRDAGSDRDLRTVPARGEDRPVAARNGDRTATASGPAHPAATSGTGGPAGASVGAPVSEPVRLDALLASRGLVRSRTAAARLVQAGRVAVDGVAVVKPSQSVRPGATLTVDPEDDWVSRAAHKLIAALDAFGVEPDGRVVLDVGASTGGFTQVLLERRASRVIALDVGHGQLDRRVAGDRRVVVVEGVNARDLTADAFAAVDAHARDTTLVVADLSFISLRLVLPALTAAVPADEFVLLVKPQFEVGRSGVREGIVHDPDLRDDAVMNVLWTAHDLGLGVAGVIGSPIVGTHGNHEFLVHLLRGGGTEPSGWREQVRELAGAPVRTAATATAGPTPATAGPTPAAEPTPAAAPTPTAGPTPAAATTRNEDMA